MCACFMGVAAGGPAVGNLLQPYFFLSRSIWDQYVPVLLGGGSSLMDRYWRAQSAST
jgi:hypothetical protein